jgi:hypothetical protein
MAVANKANKANLSVLYQAILPIQTRTLHKAKLGAAATDAAAALVGCVRRHA